MDSEPSSLRLPPIQFRPVLKNYIWGGRNLASVLGRKLPDGSIAESWEISDHPHGETKVDSGPRKGSSLTELVREAGPGLLGARNLDSLERGRFPLLIKLLDANDWLSVQVHPTDEYSLEHEGDLGKTEMWIVLDAKPGAEVLLGFDRDVTAQEFSDLAARGATDQVLHRVKAQAGDVFFVPAGRIHAIGPGLVLAEIQQTSDVTYRVFDWNRSQEDGRKLHLAPALEVVDFSDLRPGPVQPVALEPDEPGDPGCEDPAVRSELLVECPYFRTERIRLDAGGVHRGRLNGATFEIWGATSGSACLQSGHGTINLPAVSWALLPANLGRFEVRPTGEGPAELLRVLTPCRA